MLSNNRGFVLFGAFICTLSSGCVCLKSQVKENLPRPLETVSIREYGSAERILRIPESGMAVGDLLHGINATAMIPMPSVSPDDLEGDFSEIDTHIQNVKSFLRTRNEVSTVAAIESDQVGANKLDKVVTALVALRDKNRIAFKDQADAKAVTRAMFNVFKSGLGFETFLSSPEGRELLTVGNPTPSRVGTVPNVQTPQTLVTLRRRNGQELLFPLALVSTSSLGAILLDDGDAIHLNYLEQLVQGSSNRVCNVAITGRHVGEDAVYSLDGNKDTLRSLSERDGSDISIVPSDEANVIVLTRLNNAGRAQIHILPTKSITSQAEVRNILDQYFVQDGDLVHFDTLDLMQIILGSRAIHRQKQRNALEASHRIGERVRLAEPSCQNLSERFSTVVESGSSLPVAKQARAFGIIARERFNAGVGAVGGALGVR